MINLLVDAIGVRRGSAAIVIGNTLVGWTQAFPDDRITVLVDRDPEFTVPASVMVQHVTLGHAPAVAVRLWGQTVGVRREARRIRADALLSAVTASAFLGARCPHGVMVYDLRHELRPAQFPRRRRIVRRLLYGWSFRRADALFCISERTRGDLVRRRPRLAAKSRATLLGADHAAAWQRTDDPAAYVLAFGHFANKNVDAVLHAWARYCEADTSGLILRICGLSAAGRAHVEAVLAGLDNAARVELMGWLQDDEFQTLFAGASMVLFPSDFEGFGLPAVEAMLLGVPVVVSDDPALLEVTAGHAVVTADHSPAALAAALVAARARTPDELAAAQAHARTFTWARTASQMQQLLVRQPGSPPTP
ncbi:MAG: glycosyltransferase [Actinomycetota bacterium]|nr:glycosyltransferase [Actinomycetota bacterium]